MSVRKNELSGASASIKVRQTIHQLLLEAEGTVEGEVDALEKLLASAEEVSIPAGVAQTQLRAVQRLLDGLTPTPAGEHTGAPHPTASASSEDVLSELVARPWASIFSLVSLPAWQARNRGRCSVLELSTLRHLVINRDP